MAQSSQGYPSHTFSEGTSILDSIPMVESVIGSFDSQSNAGSVEEAEAEFSPNFPSSHSSFIVRSASYKSSSSSDFSPQEAADFPEEAGVKSKNLALIGIAIIIGATVLMKVLRRVL